MKDSYETRALFLIMWHGAPSSETKQMFPDWWHQLMKFKSGSVDETLWLNEFCKEAVRMKS
jgi:hypothetical protein